MMKFHLDGKTKKYVKKLKKLSFTKDIPITHLRVDVKLDLESVDFATIDGFFTFIQTFKEQQMIGVNLLIDDGGKYNDLYSTQKMQISDSLMKKMLGHCGDLFAQ